MNRILVSRLHTACDRLRLDSPNVVTSRGPEVLVYWFVDGRKRQRRVSIGTTDVVELDPSGAEVGERVHIANDPVAAFVLLVNRTTP